MRSRLRAPQRPGARAHPRPDCAAQRQDRLQAFTALREGQAEAAAANVFAGAADDNSAADVCAGSSVAGDNDSSSSFAASAAAASTASAASTAASLGRRVPG
jgi:hypothetical protein